MAIDQKAPIPKAFAVEAGEMNGQKGLVLTLPFNIYLRDMRNDIDNAAIILPDGRVSIADGTASVATTVIFTPLTDGLYWFQYAASVNTPAGVASSLTTAIDWTWNTNVKTKTFTAMNGNTIGTSDSNAYLFYADAGSPIRYTLTYTSNPASAMRYSFYALVSSVATTG